MNKNHQLLYIILGAAAGTFVGTFFPEWGVKSEFLGTLFLNALKTMVLPLIITSLIVGVTNLGDMKRLGGLGGKTLLYYTVTTGLAVLIGLMVVNTLKPGVGIAEFAGELPETLQSGVRFSFTDVFVGIIHPNLFEAATDFKILPLILASIVAGLALVSLGEASKPAVDLFFILNNVVMKVVLWIMVFAPLGIYGLIAHRVGITGGGEAVLGLLSQLANYCIAVISGLLIHGAIALPLLLLIFARRNPLVYAIQMAKALLTAAATASSSATLPLTMECTTREAKVSQKTSSVVLPLGATINMDGTALYEAVAAMFIAQSYGISLGPGEQCIIFFTATLASVGAAGIPEAGLVTMMLVLQSVGLPVEGIGLILAVDWILDRMRTAVNVWGDSVGAAIIDSGENH